MASIKVFEFGDMCYLAWSVDGDLGGLLRRAWLLREDQLAKLTARLKSFSLSEEEEQDLECHYVYTSVISFLEPDAVKTVDYEAGVLLFNTRERANAAKKAANEGVKRFKAEKKAARRKHVVEPYWAPLARAAGWTPPCGSQSTSDNIPASPSSPTTDNS